MEAENAMTIPRDDEFTDLKNESFFKFKSSNRLDLRYDQENESVGVYYAIKCMMFGLVLLYGDRLW